MTGPDDDSSDDEDRPSGAPPDGNQPNGSGDANAPGDAGAQDPANENGQDPSGTQPPPGTQEEQDPPAEQIPGPATTQQPMLPPLVPLLQLSEEHDIGFPTGTILRPPKYENLSRGDVAEALRAYWEKLDTFQLPDKLHDPLDKRAKSEYSKVAHDFCKPITAAKVPFMDCSFSEMPYEYYDEYASVMDLDDPRININYSVFKSRLYTQYYETHAQVVADMITTIKNHIKFHAAGKEHSRLYSAINAKILLEKWCRHFRRAFPDYYS